MPFSLKKNKSLIILICLILAQLILISAQVPLGGKENYLEKAIFSLFSPIQHGALAFIQKIGDLWRDYFYLRDVRGINERLSKEIFALQQQNILLQHSLKKYKNEEEIQEILEEIFGGVLPARVIGLDTGSVYRSVVINKGSKNGLQEDMVVVDRKGHLVGRVIPPVSFMEAKVHLITDSDSGVSVFTEKLKVPGILNGDGKGQCILKYIIATDDRVEVGENLITSGFDGIIPPGISAGVITSITTDKSLFKKISVSPYFTINHLDQIAVIALEPKEFF